jgi:hypothetical protein
VGGQRHQHRGRGEASFLNPLGGGSFSLTLDGENNALFLNFTPVPEPSTYALLSLGLIGILLTAGGWRRRLAGRQTARR